MCARVSDNEARTRDTRAFLMLKCLLQLYRLHALAVMLSVYLANIYSITNIILQLQTVIRHFAAYAGIMI